MIVESNFTLRDGRTSLPFAGIRGGLAIFGEAGWPGWPLLLGRRVGAVLQLEARADLRHGLVRPGVPPEALQQPEVRVGGAALVATLALALGW